MPHIPETKHDYHPDYTCHDARDPENQTVQAHLLSEGVLYTPADSIKMSILTSNTDVQNMGVMLAVGPVGILATFNANTARSFGEKLCLWADEQEAAAKDATDAVFDRARNGGKS